MTEHSEIEARVISTTQTLADLGNAEEISLSEIFTALLKRWRLVAGVPLLAAVLAVGGSYLIPPTFTARTSFLAPQQQQGGAAAALASLGALSGLAGGVKSTGDQYLALLQSTMLRIV